MFEVVLSLLALVVAVTALFRALLDHRSYNREFRQIQKQVLDAQRLLKQRSLLAGEVIHEIKNPLSAILCSAEALEILLKDKLDDTNRESLKYIKEYGDNLLRLLSNFLEVTRAESNTIQAKPMPTNVPDVVESIIGLLSASAMRKQIKLDFFSQAPDLVAHVDLTHLKQVLFNLIHNGIKFTDPHGHIRVVISDAFPKPYITVAIKDNGSGIPESELSTIFDIYSRLGGQRNTLDTGAGLGLALVKSLVELAGGVVRVESKLGVGSSFEFTLPKYIPPAKKTEPNEDFKNRGQTPLAGQTFLLVDEDRALRATVAQLIQAWGGMVDSVSSAADAVKAIQGKHYDAVMLDSTDDGVGPYELARAIREDLHDDKTTVIIASKTTIDERLAQTSGADRCIEKPLNGQVLLESLLKSGRYSITH